MPYIITTSLYPNDKASEAGERYLEALAKYPPDESIGQAVVQAAVTTTLQGIKVMTVYDVVEGKLDAAYNRIANMMVMFQNIAGFKYSLETFFKAEEALSLVGLNMPE